MLRQAQQKAFGEDSSRVIYLSGDALAIPLADNSVDVVTGFTLALFPAERYREFIREGLRVARDQVVYVGIPPGWYGGDLDPVIENPYKGTFDVEVDRIFIEEYQFDYQDLFSDQEYRTIENIVSIYGFIFGKKAIEQMGLCAVVDVGQAVLYSGVRGTGIPIPTSSEDVYESLFVVVTICVQQENQAWLRQVLTSAMYWGRSTTLSWSSHPGSQPRTGSHGCLTWPIGA